MSKPYILGIIPARGNSKGVPRKNIRPVAGIPLLAYILSSALNSRRLSRVVVSSEDDEVLEVARRYGGHDVSLLRPDHLSEDTTSDVPVLQHVTSEVEKTIGHKVDYIVQLHATTPFVTADDIDCSLGKLVSADIDSVVSVHQVNDYHPVKMKRLKQDGLLEQYVAGLEELSTARRQDYEPVYRRNGGLYASRRGIVMDRHRVFGDKVLGHVMSAERSVDVNNHADFIMVEALGKILVERGELEWPIPKIS